MCKEMDERDLRMDVFSYGVKNLPVTIKITHMPTGFSVQGEGMSHVKLRKELLERLVNKIENAQNGNGAK